MKLFPTFLALCLIISSAAAGVGEWKTYTDMKNVRSIVVADGQIWAATSGGAFRYDVTNSSFRRFTNIDGLSTIDVTAIAKDEANQIYVGSSRGYIDIYNPANGSWITIPDIARSTSKPQRGINKFVISGEKMYIATDFGVIVFSPRRREFGDTFSKFGAFASPTKVNDILLHDGKIIVATDKGVAIASLATSNLQEPSAWTTYSTMNGLPSANILSVGVFQNSIIAGTNAGAALLKGSSFELLPLPKQDASISLITSNAKGEVFLLATDVIYQMNGLADFSEFLRATDIPTTGKLTFSSIVFLNDGTNVISTNAGISVSSTGKTRSLIKPNGPNSNQFIGLSIDTDGILWSASGRDAAGRGIYSFDGMLWTNYTRESHPILATDSYVNTSKGNNGSRWCNAWGDGSLLIYRDGSMKRFTAANVPGFPGVATFPNFNVTHNTTIDSKGTTWTTHYRGSNQTILSAFTKDSTWAFFQNRATSGDEVIKTVVDLYGTKWILINDQVYRGFILFHENGTLTDQSDDRWDAISATDPSGIDAGMATDVAIDLTGDIWIGTDIGLRTIFNPNNPKKVSRTCNNTRCNVEGQYINSIAIDALNNKWLGTRAGVFVLAPDGSTIIAQYDVNNSPLIDNDVKSIVVHPKTGVAYFGTDKGLSSLGTTSIAPNESSTDLHVKPNPFRPEDGSSIMIDGLTEGSTLKILSIDGSLVAEIETPGGRVGFWDGTGKDGKLVATGVYIVVAYNFDGSKVGLGKIAVIR